MTEGRVLHTARALVELGIGELRDVEGIGDQTGTGLHDLQHASIGPGPIKGAELDARTERCRLLGLPAHGLGTPATNVDISRSWPARTSTI